MTARKQWSEWVKPKKGGEPIEVFYFQLPDSEVRATALSLATLQWEIERIEASLAKLGT